jgi:hypothetical protein
MSGWDFPLGVLVGALISQAGFWTGYIVARRPWGRVGS